MERSAVADRLQISPVQIGEAHDVAKLLARWKTRSLVGEDPRSLKPSPWHRLAIAYHLEPKESLLRNQRGEILKYTRALVFDRESDEDRLAWKINQMIHFDPKIKGCRYRLPGDTPWATAQGEYDRHQSYFAQVTHHGMLNFRLSRSRQLFVGIVSVSEQKMLVSGLFTYVTGSHSVRFRM